MPLNKIETEFTSTLNDLLENGKNKILNLIESKKLEINSLNNSIERLQNETIRSKSELNGLAQEEKSGRLELKKFDNADKMMKSKTSFISAEAEELIDSINKVSQILNYPF